MSSFPCLVRFVSSSGQVWYRLGDGLVDRYLEFVAGRCGAGKVRVGIAQALNSQGRKPTGPLGWVTAWVMPVLFTSLYAKVARRLDLQPEDDVLDVACGSGGLLEKARSPRAPHCRAGPFRDPDQAGETVEP